MKKTILLLMVLMIIPLSYAMENCKPYTPVDEIPCLILLANNNSVTPCNSITVSFYDNNSNLLYTQSMSPFSGGFKCNATFNETGLGTYPFLYSTGDTGTIVVERGVKMELLLYAIIGVSLVLLIIGWAMKNHTVVALSGILMIVTGVFVTINGFSIFDNIMTQGLGFVFAMLGVYLLIVPNLEWWTDIMNNITN